MSVRGDRPGAPAAPQPYGAILAGGAGRRIGGAKAIVELHGRPLICFPLEAMRSALGELAVVAKASSELPQLPGVTVWIEPGELRHPLVGLLHALAMADGRAVLACPVDLPFVTPATIAALAAADAEGAPAVIAAGGAVEQPLLGRYEPAALGPLREALADPSVPLRTALAGLRPKRFEVGDPDELFNVNAPEDLLQAAALLDRRRPPSRT